MKKQISTERLEAEKRFQANPSKCFQRHIREVYGESEQKPKIESLKGAIVRRINHQEAATIILRYEWLKTMAMCTVACFGLFIGSELLGATCFTRGASFEARACICGEEYAEKTICLARGACVPHAPDNAASFLIRHACRLARKEFGWEIFFAYSDPSAGEVGTVYQAVGWIYLGSSLGRTQKFHTDFVKGDHRISTHNVKKTALRRGWTPEMGITKRKFLDDLGYTRVRTLDKAKWVWFENKELRTKLIDKPQPYPKRMHGV